MSDTIAQDATPHPRHGIRRRPANLSSPRRPEDHSDSSDDEADDINLIPSSSGSRSHSRQGTTPSSANNSRPQSRGASRKNWDNDDVEDSDSENDSDSEDSDDDEEEDNGRRRRRRRRLSSSASHILAQAPAVPDLRFDHNYRKALDQCYESFANDTARAQTAFAAATTEASEKPGSKPPTPISVPSVTARITVMTLRDIIIMPFVHGFFWGFGTVLLTLVGQRSLFYHVNRTWSRFFGSSSNEKPMTIRGEPARVRRFGGGTSKLSGVGLMSAGSSAPGIGRPY
ncbi:hypothetical protein BGZ83_006923 [Gryganskiella cystojenkinii]|nr:hypothetical protein BGZ83_006923 [Gryganskiella cystojenkinii]